MPDNKGAVDLSVARTTGNLSEEEQAAVDALAEKHNTEQDVLNVRTAFLVYVDEEGSVQVTSDLDVAMGRQFIPSADDVYGAVSVIQKDFIAQEAASHTVNLTQQVAMQMQQQMRQQQQAAAIQQQIDQRGGLHR